MDLSFSINLEYQMEVTLVDSCGIEKKDYTYWVEKVPVYLQVESQWKGKVYIVLKDLDIFSFLILGKGSQWVIQRN